MTNITNIYYVLDEMVNENYARILVLKCARHIEAHKVPRCKVQGKGTLLCKKCLISFTFHKGYFVEASYINA